jgi:DNA-binding transcriptional MerR regulator
MASSPSLASDRDELSDLEDLENREDLEDLHDPVLGDGEDARDMTIDELSRRAGTTTRNVRALQSAGLLIHPTIRGRTAHYDGRHLDRLGAVIRLQHSGFSLASIRALFEALDDGRTLADVLGLRHPVGHLSQTTPVLRLLSILPSTLLD